MELFMYLECKCNNIIYYNYTLFIYLKQQLSYTCVWFNLCLFSCTKMTYLLCNKWLKGQDKSYFTYRNILVNLLHGVEKDQQRNTREEQSQSVMLANMQMSMLLTI